MTTLAVYPRDQQDINPRLEVMQRAIEELRGPVIQNDNRERFQRQGANHEGIPQGPEPERRPPEQ